MLRGGEKRVAFGNRPLGQGEIPRNFGPPGGGVLVGFAEMETRRGGWLYEDVHSPANPSSPELLRCLMDS